MVRIATEGLAAEIVGLGAELQRLQDSEGRDLLWHGDAAWWGGRAPLLFPIVGKVPGDEVLIDGKTYRLPKHGFARASEFSLVDADASCATFELRSNSSTRVFYPFDFVLTVTYAIAGTSLLCRAIVSNLGASAMPVAFGFHPAFLWPLPYDARREAYEVGFERDEVEPIWRVRDELLTGPPVLTPIEGRVLKLKDELFQPGALIFLSPQSRSVTYGVAGRPFLKVEFPEMPQLGIWTKPGAPYVCIEPWSGYAAPHDFAGDLSEKPGMTLVASGTTQAYEMTISVFGGSP